jgi:hypothetical protein
VPISPLDASTSAKRVSQEENIIPVKYCDISPVGVNIIRAAE